MDISWDTKVATELGGVNGSPGLRRPRRGHSDGKDPVHLDSRWARLAAWRRRSQAQEVPGISWEAVPVIQECGGEGQPRVRPPGWRGQDGVCTV